MAVFDAVQGIPLPLLEKIENIFAMADNEGGDSVNISCKYLLDVLDDPEEVISVL